MLGGSGGWCTKRCGVWWMAFSYRRTKDLTEILLASKRRKLTAKPPAIENKKERRTM